jgi:outer membrane receptor protein involved in Fe transport
MKKLLTFFIVLGWMAMLSTFGQGTVRGRVTDENGEPLIGATISLKLKPTVGTITDYDGNFSFNLSESTPQIIVVSFISYASITDTVKLKKGEILVRNYDLVPVANQINEVQIVAKAVKSRDVFMEKAKIRSAVTLDYISAETIKRTGDGNVSAAVSRITGVTSTGGFISVRGIGDRYLKTAVNGSKIATLDPFTNNFKLDLFPSNLVDNIVITKTASPNLPGDWAGAYVDVETKDYPEKLMINIETSFGYNTQSTFKNVLTSDHSPTDWLGFDNGFRQIDHQKPVYYDGAPKKYDEFAALGLEGYFNAMGVFAETPWDPNDVTSVYTRLALVQLGFLGEATFNDQDAITAAINAYNSSDLKQQALVGSTMDVVKMGQSLPNNWLTYNKRGPIGFSQSFSIGNQKNVFNRPLGFIFGLKYTSANQYDPAAFYGRSDMEDRFVYDTTRSVYITEGNMQHAVEDHTWSALVNLAYKVTPNNSISFLFMPNIIGMNKLHYDSVFTFTGSGYLNYNSHVQNYESRRQFIYQVNSTNYLPSAGIKIVFNASLTNGKSSTPDFKQLNYEFDPSTGNMTNLFTTSIYTSNFRIFRDLREDLFDSRISVEVPLSGKSENSRKLHFGASYQYTARNADQKSYIIPSRAAVGRIYNNDLKGYLSIDSFGIDKGVIKRFYDPYVGPKYNTNGFSNSLGGFVMVDYAFSPALRITGGLRVENAHVQADILDYYDREYPIDDERRYGINPGLMDKTSVLPSASLIYSIRPSLTTPTNMRITYSKAVAYPSIREITNFEVFDYNLLGVVTGNPDLKPVEIDNYDFRFESYLASGDNISLSLFYKNFTNHIELIRDVRDFVYYTWQNAEKSTAMGIEIEGRKVITKNLDLRANMTLVKSETNLIYTPAGFFTSDTIQRTMYGQAPYVFNGILTYNSPKLKLNFAVSYNVQGPKLAITGNFGSPDIYELPRHMIDIRIAKSIGKYFSVSLKIRDLLGTPTRRAYKYSAGWWDFDRYNYGTSYIFGISYNL